MKINELSNFGIDADSVRKCVRSYHNGEITVTVTGEFSSGKSRFINALLGREELLPYGETECTPIYAELVAGETDSLAVLQYDGGRSVYELNPQNMNRFARFGENFDCNTAAVNISLGDFRLNRRIHIVDTPGTNTVFSQHEQITRHVLNRSDLVIYLFNKTISNLSLGAIEEIYRQNKNIIFVMTHIDEKEGFNYLDAAEIGRLLTESGNSIAKLLGVQVNTLSLFPVGSVRAFSDDTYIRPIIDYINRFSENCSKNTLHSIAENKINIIIDKAVCEQENALKSLIAANNIESDELSERIESAKKKTDALRSEISSIGSIIVQCSENAEKNAVRKINQLSDKYVTNLESVIDKMTSENIDEMLNREISKTCEKYESDVTGEIKKSVNNIMTSAYKSAANKISEVMDDIKIPGFERFNLETPVIDNTWEFQEFDDSEYIMKIRQCDLEEESLNDARIRRAAEINQAKERRDQAAEEYNKAVKERADIGAYIPQMDEIVEKSGGEGGKRIGRVLGEIADFALLFINPAGEAAELGAKTVAEGAKAIAVADKIKDGAKVAQYVANAVSDAANEEQSDEELPNEKSNGALSKIAKVLDRVSVGHWGEKIGEAIGDAVKPEYVYHKENEQKRIEYEEKLKYSNAVVSERRREVDRYEDEVQKLSDMSEFDRKSRLIQAQRQCYEEEKRADEEAYRKNMEYENLSSLKKAYIRQIKEAFENQTAENCSYIKSIIASISELVRQAVEYDYSDKLRELEDELSRLNCGKEKLAEQIVSQKKRIASFEEIRNSVNLWLDGDNSEVENA